MSVCAVKTKFIQWLSETRLCDIGTVGGKNAALGEMIHGLQSLRIRIPNGFAVTAEAYWEYMHHTKLIDEIAQILGSMNQASVDSIHHCGVQIRHLIMSTPLPDEISHAIVDAYHSLSDGRGLISVAVRSSATAEDLPDASFAGQQETYLNVSGQAFLLDAYQRCVASLFTDRAITYRITHNFDHLQVALSVGVQEMVRSDLACAGVMFTLDTETGFPNIVVINAAYGLGENVVQGCVDPDEYRVFKLTLAEPFQPILRKTLGSKAIRMIYDTGGSKLTRNELVRLGGAQAGRSTQPRRVVGTVCQSCVSTRPHAIGLSLLPQESYVQRKTNSLRLRSLSNSNLPIVRFAQAMKH